MNPVLKSGTFDVERGENAGIMTVSGTVNKTFFLLALCAGSAGWSWTQPELMPLLWVFALAGFGMAMLTVFVKTLTPYTAPAYAVLEGLVMGTLSMVMERRYPGIVIQSVGLTFGTLAMMLFAYKARWIQATEKFKMGVMAATGAICLVYLVTFLFNYFGHSVSMIHQNGWVGIGFSVVVVGVAALNLILDFDLIEQGSAQNAPKYMEWYGAFALMVTLIWLYLEILRLLSKGRSRS